MHTEVTISILLLSPELSADNQVLGFWRKPLKKKEITRIKRNSTETENSAINKIMIDSFGVIKGDTASIEQCAIKKDLFSQQKEVMNIKTG